MKPLHICHYIIDFQPFFCQLYNFISMEGFMWQVDQFLFFFRRSVLYGQRNCDQIVHVSDYRCQFLLDQSSNVAIVISTLLKIISFLFSYFLPSQQQRSIIIPSGNIIRCMQFYLQSNQVFKSFVDASKICQFCQIPTNF